MAETLKNQSEGFGTLGVALLASIIFVYLIMVGLYDSYVYPLVVLFSIPLAIIGALLALALSASTLSIFSILGIIMLIGLVAKNAILVVDFTNNLKRGGVEVKEALIEADTDPFPPDPDDDPGHGNWYVADCIGQWPWRRMEKRAGLGADWRPYQLHVPDPDCGAGYLLPLRPYSGEVWNG